LEPLYRCPDVALGAALERDILGSLTAQLRVWRPRFATRIRADVSAALRPLLIELEARAAGARGDAVFPTSEGLVRVAPGAIVDTPVVSSDGVIQMNEAGRARRLASAATMRSGTRDLEAEHRDAIRRAASRYDAAGAPINLTYTSLENVLRRVKATRLHATEDETAQFALAVLVVPYPNDIFSVWVYALLLTPLAASGAAREDGKSER
jgi:hypothetical protein